MYILIVVLEEAFLLKFLQVKTHPLLEVLGCSCCRVPRAAVVAITDAATVSAVNVPFWGGCRDVLSLT